ncbi:hypothetical protein D3C81_2190990 [compost metagenome]
MGVERLARNEGMLFVFERSERHCMWMKNTQLPLRVIFLDARFGYLNHHDMQPFDETLHCSAGAARYALEIAQP